LKYTVENVSNKAHIYQDADGKFRVEH